MPQAVTHVLVSIILLSIFRHIYHKKTNKKFPLQYVLIGGLAGVIPDLDIALFWIIYYLGYTLEQVHRTFIHTLFIPLIFLALAFISKLTIKRKIGRNKLSISIIFILFAFSSLIHLILDATLAGYIMPLYPLSLVEVGTGFPFTMLPEHLAIFFLATLDGVLFILWILYLELKHKISDFI
ncbi:metal-dependent hydrolase [Candidatus Pacearchaeota archaeon]|nr:metal-dependent hydrolase [Candidatus Pacearchaeota archaeon]